MSRGGMAGMAAGPANLSEAIFDSFVESDKAQSVKGCVQLLLGQAPNGSAANVSPATLQRLVILALDVLKTGEFEVNTRESIAADEILTSLFTGLYSIFGSASRRRVEDKVIIEDLRRMGLSRDIVNIIVGEFLEKKLEIEEAVRSSRLAHPFIERLEWRVDVTVTSSQLNRVFKPSVLFQVTTSTGEIKTFECSMDKFHLLRYSVARMLAAVQNIEQNPTLKRLIE